MRIENSVVLVTGGASGIGESITEYFLSKGAFVYICDLQVEKGKSLEQKHKNLRFVECDITNEEKVIKLFEVIRSEKGQIDTVINSAGIARPELFATTKSVHKNSTWETVFKINTFGTFLVSKHAAKLMIEKSNQSNECNGNIIMISSVAGLEGQRGQTAYAGSKGAILGMVLPMARDLGKYKIRVNAIAPGIIETPMTSGIMSSGPMQSIINQTALKCPGKPIHIALAAESIILNDFLNATYIRVDGGVRFPQF